MTTKPETPTFEKTVNDAIDKKLIDVHTCMPGRVVKININTQWDVKCDVQPLLKKKYKSQSEPVKLPVIVDVPIVTLRCGKAFINLPIKVGDGILLLFSERSLDKWLVQGGEVDPQDRRKFHLSDAIAIPGMYDFSQKIKADPNNIVIVNDKTRTEFLPNGKFKIRNDSYEFVSVQSGLIDTLINAKVLTAIGAQPFTADTVAKLTQDKQKLDSFKA